MSRQHLGVFANEADGGEDGDPPGYKNPLYSLKHALHPSNQIIEQVHHPSPHFSHRQPCSKNGSRTRSYWWHAGIGACFALPRSTSGGSNLPPSVDPFRPRVCEPHCSRRSSVARFAGSYACSGESPFHWERY